jgi:sn-glycerol 3-phosphate transport system substrate-binding protein
VLSTDETALQFLADSGVVVPASSCLAADPDARALYDDLLPAVRSANTIGDVLWPAAPIGLSAVMYQNDAHLRDAGLDPASPPATLDEVRAAAEAIRDAAIPGVDTPVVMRLDAWLPEYWTTGAGEAVVDRDNGHDGLATESRYDNPATRDLLEWIDGMVDDGLLKLTDNADLVAAFLALGNGSSSILFDGSAAISTVSAVVSGSLTPEQSGLEEGQLPGGAQAGLDVSVAPLPGLRADSSGQVLGGGWYLVDNGDPQQVAAAWDFFTYFLGTEQQVTWAIDSSYLPVQQAAADSPRLQAFWADTQPGRWMAIANESFVALDPEFPGPIIGPYAEFRLDVIQALESLADGSTQVDAAIDDVSTGFGDQLQAYRDEVGG